MYLQRNGWIDLGGRNSFQKLWVGAVKLSVDAAVQLKQSNTLESNNTNKSTRTPASDLHIDISWESCLGSCLGDKCLYLKNGFSLCFCTRWANIRRVNVPHVLYLESIIFMLIFPVWLYLLVPSFTWCESYMKGSVSPGGISKTRYRNSRAEPSWSSPVSKSACSREAVTAPLADPLLMHSQ